MLKQSPLAPHFEAPIPPNAQPTTSSIRRRLVAALLVPALLTSCSAAEEFFDDGTEAAAESQADITDALESQGADMAAAANIANSVYGPVQQAREADTPAEQMPSPTSTVATLEALYGTEFGISTQTSPETAATALSSGGKLLDVTTLIEESDRPYLPSGLLVITTSPEAPSFKLSVSVATDLQEDFDGRSALANANGVTDIQAAIDDGSLRFIFAPKAETAAPASTPTTPPAAEAPAGIAPEVISQGPTDRPEIALTFDADMTPNMQNMLASGEVPTWYNEGVIDALVEHDAPATLFLTGLWAETYPEEAAALADNPLFEIANHSHTHPAFTEDCHGLRHTVSETAAKEEEITASQAAIAQATGVTPTLFRFAGLCHTDSDVQLVAQHGMRVIDGVTSGDAGQADPNAILQTTLANAENGSILVFHMHGDGGVGDGRFAPATAEALDEIIPALQEDYELVTVSQLLD